MTATDAARLLACPDCGHAGLAVTGWPAAAEDVRDGVATCAGCLGWFRIEDGVVELLPASLRDHERSRAFRARHENRRAAWAPEPVAVERDGDAAKREAIAYFRERAAAYDTAIVGPPFWHAMDDRLLGIVSARRAGTNVAIEVGAGTGRLTRRLAARFARTIHVDLSEAMVREAVARRPDDGARTLFVVGDAERLPLADGVADAVVIAGAATYMGDPAAAIREAARLLVPGGVLACHENHRSAARPLFEALSRRWSPWTGKSWPPSAALAVGDLERWCARAGLSARCRTRVFVPPQVVNLMPPAPAGVLLAATDALAGLIPWVRNQGGLIFVDAVRPV